MSEAQCGASKRRGRQYEGSARWIFIGPRTSAPSSSAHAELASREDAEDGALAQALTGFDGMTTFGGTDGPRPDESGIQRDDGGANATEASTDASLDAVEASAPDATDDASD
jgi:hypothetical protein